MTMSHGVPRATKVATTADQASRRVVASESRTQYRRALSRTDRHATSASRDLYALHWPAAPFDAEAGAPDAIVLLHGLGDTSDVWRPMMERWRPRAPVLAFDLPGHGRSPWLAPDAYRVTILAEQVAQALLLHEVCRPLLVGHSLGARISVHLAAAPTLRAQGCVLVDMGAVPDAEVAAMIADHIDALRARRATLEELVTLVVDRLPLADQEAVGVAVSAMASYFEGAWRVPLDPSIKRLLVQPPGEEVWQALASVSGPAGIIRGACSAVLDRKAASKIAAALPCKPVPMHEVQMAGHAVPLEKPAALARAIDACLSEMFPASRSV